MNRCMTLPISLIAIGFLLSGTLTGCSTDRFSSSNDKTSELAGESGIGDKIKDLISSDNEDFKTLKAQIEQQQQQLEAMNAEQQALQQQLKRQQVAVTIKASTSANAGRAKQGTASTAYIAFLEEDSQFTEVETLATKEISVIPNRDTQLTLNIPQEAHFIAVKVGLRYTKKRSQFLIPIASLNFDTPLTLNIGACDVTITEGISPEQAPEFTTKLKYYQQPLVSCS